MKCPFSGKPCIRPKEIYVRDIQDGEEHILHMCRKCGEEYLANLPEVEVMKKLTHLMETPEGVEQVQEILEEKNFNDQTPCPRCGTSLMEILSSQKIGCPECFTFHKISEMLEAFVQPPDKVEDGSELESNILEVLENELRMAIEDEDYEWAAEIRDEIEKLKNDE